jgi:FkbM family methyltransferase
LNGTLRETLRAFLPRGLKAHRIRRGPLAGHRIYTSWHDYPGAISGGTEAPLLAWFARHVKPGETWLDIGAHYGYTGIALAKLVGETGRVIAFEPVTATAGCVSRTRELNRLTQLHVVPLGLSARPGIRPVELPVFRGMADSTLPAKPASATVIGQLIFLSSFDHLWESLSAGNSCVNGVKIDVQGMEYDVLAGMKDTLRRCHPKLVIEFHPGVDRSGILQFLTQCGYCSKPQAVEPGSEDNPIEDNKSYAFFPSGAPD